MPSSIEWLWPPGFKGESWNPVTGCEKVSPGCAYCYAELFARRFPKSAGYSPNYLPGTARIVSHEDRLAMPLRWKSPRFVFVNSQSDLFHADVPDDFIAAVFGVMSITRRHTFLILTKRPQRMFEVVNNLNLSEIWLRGTLKIPDMQPWNANAERDYDYTWPLPNVWLGVSAENQRFANARIPLLLDTPAAVRFVSYEPALKPIDFRNIIIHQGDDNHEPSMILDSLTGLAKNPNVMVPKVDWLIVGGESGAKARECVGGIEEAMRSTLTQCKDAGVAYFGKQMGSPWAKANGDRGKGENMQLWPEDLRVREWPQAAMVLA